MKLADRYEGRRPRRTGLRFGVAAVVSAAVVASVALVLTDSGKGAANLALSGNTTSGSMQMSSTVASSYQVITLNDNRDLTFNQLLGVNNEGDIAGYFGSGAAGHPNKGYELVPPFAQTAAQNDFRNENFPGSAQTQVTGLNDNGVTVGFWVNKSGANFGFYDWHGSFHNANFPTGTPAKPPVDQLLGVNNSGIAVGFFTNSSGTNRGYEYNIRTRQFSRVLPPGASNSNLGGSLTAAGINNRGDVTGFYNKTSSTVDAFLKPRFGRFITLAFPGASMTQAFGVNDSDEVVGTYTTGSGNSAVSHGFVWQGGKFSTVDIGGGATATTVNGVNDEGDLVGFYTDAKGNTDGFMALP